MALNGESNSKEIINSETQAAEAARLRAELLDLLRRGQVFRTAAVEQAFASVPRENFLPATIPLSKVYIDDAIPVKYNDEGMATSSSSQPYLMADMLEVLHLRPGLKVLEIGAGVGYNAALMAHILGDGELVTTIDLDPDMAQYARENLQRLGPPYSAITVVAADGALGYPPNAPYDRIIVTVQQWEISPYWVEQLKPGGLLELPISISPHVWGGLLPCFRKEEDGTLTAIDASNGGFMPMRGEMEHPLSRRENQLHQRLVKTALPPPILLPPYYYNKELSLYLSLEEWLEPYIPLLQDTNVFQDKNGLLSRTQSPKVVQRKKGEEN
jgi:protein-L-isoaspartate(D-aspartate) O-methyltransferase